jgi:hypothetical protein
MKKNVIIASISLLLAGVFGMTVHAASDPFATRGKPFGANIEGVQLGMTFNSLNDVICFAKDKLIDNPSELRLGVTIRILQKNEDIGCLDFYMNADGKIVNKISFDGPMFFSNPDSLKEQALVSDLAKSVALFLK